MAMSEYRPEAGKLFHARSRPITVQSQLWSGTSLQP